MYYSCFPARRLDLTIFFMFICIQHYIIHMKQSQRYKSINILILLAEQGTQVSLLVARSVYTRIHIYCQGVMEEKPYPSASLSCLGQTPFLCLGV